jgi:hypothetical protein
MNGCDGALHRGTRMDTMHIETTFLELAEAVFEAARESVSDPVMAERMGRVALVELLDRAVLVDVEGAWQPRRRARRRPSLVRQVG